MPKWMKENPQLKDLICKYTVRYDNYRFKRFKIIGAPSSFYHSRKRNLKTCLKQQNFFKAKYINTAKCTLKQIENRRTKK